jgi:hypothetical protein
MKLDRNINGDGLGKYALVQLRNRPVNDPAALEAVDRALATLAENGVLDWGYTGSEGEFFVIRLKDKYASGPLAIYATACEMDGEWEFGREVRELASRAGPNSPFCKRPD